MQQQTPKVMQCMEVWGGNQPVENAVQMGGLDAWVFSRPFKGAASGGDVYYVSACANDRIMRLLLADVSGHGDAVGKVALQLRHLMRRYVNHIDHLRFVRSMNDQFVSLSESGMFATALVSTYFAPKRQLTVCNAGHPPPLLYRAAQLEWSFLHKESESAEPTNLPLGIVDMASYSTFDVILEAGDLVLCHTDCLTEAQRPDGSYLGQQGLLDLIQTLPALNPATLINALIEKVAEATGHAVLEDDITLLLFAPNAETSKYNFFKRLYSSTRALGLITRTLILRDGPIPLPEFSFKNIGGALIEPFSRLWRRKK